MLRKQDIEPAEAVATLEMGVQLEVIRRKEQSGLQSDPAKVKGRESI